MKSKRFYKKLEINKTTIADLGKDEMNGVKGGISSPTCHTICDANLKLSICMCP